ncbi:MAG: hypothetical protein KF801_00275 [Cryobacterium sp.]|nr:hypothetical protein [Cryobacterium sp.]
MNRNTIHLIAGTTLAVVLAAGLTGCDPAGPAPSGSPSESSASSASPSPTEAPAAFVAPTSCTQLLGASLESSLTADGTVLFSGPGGTGLYPGIESAQDGGSPLSCVYGKDMVDLSTFELAAQGLTQDAHEGVLAELETRGMTEVAAGDTVTFTQTGDEGSTPAIIHILKPDSWVTAYSTFGGTARLAEITGWANTVETQVYP